jgi:hypothetical protein
MTTFLLFILKVRTGSVVAGLAACAAVPVPVARVVAACEDANGTSASAAATAVAPQIGSRNPH